MFKTDHFTLLHRARVVRDFFWVISSPPILNGSEIIGGNHLVTPLWIEDLQKSLCPVWTQLCHDPAPLLAWLDHHQHHRLGKYFEALLGYGLRNHPDIAELSEGIVVYQDKRSVGEMDFIYEDTQKKHYVHLEVAVKFYLHDFRKKGFEAYVGPNKIDSLARKLDHMLNKQLPLSDHYFQRKHRKPFWEVQKLCLIKGCLFEHFTFKSGSSDSVQGINSQTHINRYLTLSEWPNFLQNYGIYLWCVLPKSYWLSSLQAEDQLPVFGQEEFTECLKKLFSERPVPHMIASMNVEEKRENERLFVVPDDWMTNFDF